MFFDLYVKLPIASCLLGRKWFSRAFAAVAVALLTIAPVRAFAADVQLLEIVTKSGVHVFSVEIAKTDEELRAAFAAVAEAADEDPRVHIEAREIRALRRAGSAIWFDFATLCGGPRSQNDYLELASRFQTVILSGIPRMSAAMSSEARRFTWLIDVFYDHKVKLILSAQCPADELYTQGPMSNEFFRTVSRLMEMQSREYLAETRRASVVL